MPGRGYARRPILPRRRLPHWRPCAPAETGGAFHLIGDPGSASASDVNVTLVPDGVELDQLGHVDGQTGLEGLVGRDSGEDGLGAVHVAGRVA